MAKKNVFMNILNSIIHIRQKVKATQCPSTDEWISKMWCIQSVKYYLTTKRNEVLLNLENSMLSERRQTQKATVMVNFLCQLDWPKGYPNSW